MNKTKMLLSLSTIENNVGILKENLKNDNRFEYNLKYIEKAISNIYNQLNTDKCRICNQISVLHNNVCEKCNKLIKQNKKLD